MSSTDYEFKYIEAAVVQLEEYLLSDILYYPIGIQPPTGAHSYPQLTLGGLLLACKKASILSVTPIDKNKYTQLDKKIKEIKTSWKVYWEKKAAIEFQARLNLWRNYLEDYRRDPNSEFDRYVYEVGRRVQLELLKHETRSIKSAFFELLESLDLILRTLLIRNDFIWEKDLHAGFPSDPYWYLFGRLPSNVEK